MDTIIDRQENLALPGRGNVTLLHFHQGMVLLVGADAVGLYRDRVAIDDPLANGVIGYETIPASLQPHWQDEGGYVREHSAGYVGLNDGGVIFIRPDGVALYPHGMDALQNRNLCWVIPFPPLNA
ncbi:hypothetical protein A11A3_04335 [Alcanivorax hongdengensis A-11-3]|uniref:Uncharacterized protein n=1 Tax=Alcanivorax hongdengensis A-11-3 TaxID=1177179 RepID=L0WG95_9GAMM|nr:hypothetical protein [Alcanivorax hongdengensis]EKF75177.1 hypothetical protein A11A3_04335 [Alcanivorax hongdengensis A-11-3]